MDRICVTRLYMADLIRHARSPYEVRKSFDRPGMILIRIQQKNLITGARSLSARGKILAADTRSSCFLEKILITGKQARTAGINRR